MTDTASALLAAVPSPALPSKRHSETDRLLVLVLIVILLQNEAAMELILALLYILL